MHKKGRPRLMPGEAAIPRQQPTGGMNYMDLQTILNEREARWQTRQQLAAKHQSPVLTLVINIPGPDKNLPGVERAFVLLQAALRRELGCGCPAPAGSHNPAHAVAPPLHDESGHGADGPYWHLVLPLPPLELKQRAVRVEETHPLGRLADADVITAQGEQISRTQLELPPRRCFVCESGATLCRRTGRHNMQELLAGVHALLAQCAI